MSIDGFFLLLLRHVAKVSAAKAYSGLHSSSVEDLKGLLSKISRAPFLIQLNIERTEIAILNVALSIF